MAAFRRNLCAIAYGICATNLAEVASKIALRSASLCAVKFD